VLDGLDPFASLDLIPCHEEIFSVLREELKASVFLLALNKLERATFQGNDTSRIFILVVKASHLNKLQRPILWEGGRDMWCSVVAQHIVVHHNPPSTPSTIDLVACLLQPARLM